MKAVRLVEIGKPLELHDLPTPAAEPDEVVIRVRAAGICHSDAHYRAGKSRVHPLPMTLGHEVAGEIVETGRAVVGLAPGDRVCVHYLATCGACYWCEQGNEQFCTRGQMIGKYRDGGYAEFVRMPARSVFKLPAEIPFAAGAIMMCSSATSLHALNKARQRPGDSVAVFGVGGLGVSAIQLALARGAARVFAVDIKPSKLELAAQLGAVPINAALHEPLAALQELTSGRGVDVALELIGLPKTMEQAVRSLAIHGRAALVGLMEQTFSVAPYQEVINKEAEIIGVSDHLAAEISELLEFARAGQLRFDQVISRTIPLAAAPINDTLDRLQQFGDDLRVVIAP
jgi:propanol-preferring alcohol dehydrogenase